jgi:hypothetical protein
MSPMNIELGIGRSFGRGLNSTYIDAYQIVDSNLLKNTAKLLSNVLSTSLT